MGKWNDTDVPLAYLITFRTYGTWMPGDERGSIDKYHNVYKGARATVDESREAYSAGLLKSKPYILNGPAREAVRSAIGEVCKFRGWPLFAVNVRTNHVHAVIGAAASSDKVLGDLKSYSTRALRTGGHWAFDHSPWVDKGSKRNLWNENHIVLAVDYTLNGQGHELPDLD